MKPNPSHHITKMVGLIYAQSQFVWMVLLIPTTNLFLGQNPTSQCISLIIWNVVQSCYSLMILQFSMNPQQFFNKLMFFRLITTQKLKNVDLGIATVPMEDNIHHIFQTSIRSAPLLVTDIKYTTQKDDKLQKVRYFSCD